MGASQSTPAATPYRNWNEQHGPKMGAQVEYSALEELMKNVRSERVRTEFFKTPEKQYTDVTEIRIWASTFNLNGRKPPTDLDLNKYLSFWESRWPQRDKQICQGSPERADIYFLGFEETIPLTAQNILGATAAPPGWDQAIDRALNPWKTEEEIVHASPQNLTEADVFDYYAMGWSGVPSGNLSALVEESLAEVRNFEPFAKDRIPKGKKEDGLRRGSSLKDEVLKSEISPEPEMPRSVSADMNMDSEPSEKRAALKPRKPDAVQSSVPRNSEIPKDAEEFVQIVAYQLVGLYTTGWIRKSLLNRISGIQVTYVPTGALGVLGNKGAIATRFRIDDTPLVFITSHLASGTSKVDEMKRNTDFMEIVKRMQFPNEVELVTVDNEDGTESQSFSFQPEGIPERASYEVKKAFVGGNWGFLRNLRDMDNVIWVGDLNYRIDALPDDVIRLIRADKLNILLEVDQLSVQRALERVFQGFIEAPIDFPPTYKFIRGTGYYTGEIDYDSETDSEGEPERIPEDLWTKTPTMTSHPVPSDSFPPKSHSTDSEPPVREAIASRRTAFVAKPPIETSTGSAKSTSTQKSGGDVPVVHKKDEKHKKKKKKIRTPAWTDRILWYSSKKQLHQLLYGSFTDIQVSDHKPVVATFLLEARKFDATRIESALQEARRNIDVEEMASIPRCRLSPLVVEVGQVYYRKAVEHTVTIHNIGDVMAVYSFIPSASGGHFIRSPFPKWLSSQPTSGVIRSGKSEPLKLRVSIEGGQWGSADELFGYPEKKLDHILVMHIEGGSDFFISIVGTFKLSCFGLGLDNLALMVPENFEKLSNVMQKVDLPSLKYKEKALTAMALAAPMLEDTSLNLDDAPIQQFNQVAKFSIQRNKSGANPGFQANLTEGPSGLMIPAQVARMLYFLADDDRLKTPHIFIESYKFISKAVENNSELPNVTKIREALDQTNKFQNGTNAHDMASALFFFFFELPSPLIPESVSQNAEMSDLSARMAVSLLKEAMSSIEWSVFDATMEVMRSALMEENIKKNRITEEELARVLSHVFFQDIERAQGLPKISIHSKEIQSTSSRKSIIEQRRCLFLRQFLKVDKPLIDLDETTSEVSFKSS